MEVFFRTCLIASLMSVACGKKTERHAHDGSAMRSDGSLADDAQHSDDVPKCKANMELKTVGPGAPKICPPPCPDNSPIVNTFPINGLAVDGAGGCSPEGVQVLPNSLRGPLCKGSFSLTTKSGRLVGTNAAGTCEGADLTGSVFAVRGVNGTTVSFKIVKVQALQLDKGAIGPEGYQIERDPIAPPSTSNQAATPNKAGTTGDPNSMCNIDAANGVRRELNIPEQPKYEVTGMAAGGSNQDFVTVIPDPIYTNDVVELDNSHRFFNLACAEDALAKRSLENLYVASTDAVTEGRDLAALRMMTATYCGKPYTIRGMTFHWKSHNDSTTMKPEALWIEDRVSCIQTPRLAQKKKLDPNTLPDELKPDACKGKGKTCDWKHWADGVRAECPGGAPSVCKGNNYDFESFVGEELGQTIEYKGSGAGSGSGSGAGSGSATPAK